MRGRVRVSMSCYGISKFEESVKRRGNSAVDWQSGKALVVPDIVVIGPEFFDIELGQVTADVGCPKAWRPKHGLDRLECCDERKLERKPGLE